MAGARGSDSFMTYRIHKATVFGPAATQGSKCTIPHPSSGETIMLETGKRSRSWRQELIQEMLNDQPEKPYDEAVFVWLRIYVSRPRTHFKSDGSLKSNAPKYPKAGMDVDKVQRTIGDAAETANWVVNDSRIAGWSPLRVYTQDILEPERTEVQMYSLEQFGERFIDRVQERARWKLLDNDTRDGI